MKSEDKKELLSVMLNVCTRVITLIFLVTTLFEKFVQHKDTHWAINDIWGVLFIGFISGLGAAIFCALKEKSKISVIISHIVYFLIINAVLLFTSLNLGWFVKEFSSLMTMEIMFVLIYFAVSVLVYMLDYNEAKKINQKIQDRKNNHAKLEAQADK